MRNLEVPLRDLGIILAFGSGAGGGALVSGPSNRTTTDKSIPTWNGTTGNSLNNNALFIYNGTNLLVGTATDSGNGRIQVPAHTTNAGGIGLGTDIQIFRTGTTAMTIDAATLVTFTGGIQLAAGFNVQWTNGGNAVSVTGAGMIFSTSSATRLTLSATAATFTQQIIGSASTTARASLNIPSGTAPTSPVDGDMWYDGTNWKVRNGATTRTVTWV